MVAEFVRPLLQLARSFQETDPISLRGKCLLLLGTVFLEHVQGLGERSRFQLEVERALDV